MDTTGDEDLKLQRASADLIAELHRSLPHFLYNGIPAESGHPPAASGGVRGLVRETKTDQLIKLLEPFQEWPQLLDPHLSGLLQPLVSAFIDYASKYAAIYHQEGKPCPGVIPLPRAISKILYVFCKIRGTKVISQFLNNEPRYLEAMLDALESWAGNMYSSKENATSKYGFMVWEESFIMLLWLSHLLLAPFDLSSMSSDNAGVQLRGSLLYIDLSATIPPIAKRLVHVSTHHLSLPSKAREAAGTLLVRLAVRTDMRKIGLQKILIDWALSSVRAESDAAAPTSIYGFIGILSFLAGFIISAESGVLKPLLSRTYNSVQHAKSDQSPSSAGTNSSASARKLVIKVERALAVAGMKIDSKAPHGLSPSLGEGALEDIIDHLLTALEDKDTSVRLAASKALSVIAVELEPDMVEQIIEMIDERLYEDTLWEDAHTGADASGSCELNLGAVSALRWHGLILALSQLIFRGSMPPKSVISKVMFSLIVALRFEQRSSLGNSVGTSVRDAACFGLWALARRYSTAQIKSYKPVRKENYDGVMEAKGQVSEKPTLSASGITTAGATGSKSTENPESTLQVLANELVIAATLDAAGNIRRGASAALQEMIGRHPEEIENGIDLVQVIDYHGIALRSRAMTKIAISVSQIEPTYWHSTLRGLLDWRGVCSGDVECRRNAAHAIGLLSHSRGPEMIALTISTLRRRLHACVVPKIEERHGLLLALSEVVSRWSDVDLGNRPHLPAKIEGEIAKLWHIFYRGSGPKTRSYEGEVAMDTKLLRSALACEAICSLVAALANSLIHGKLHHPSPTELHECLEALEMSLHQSDGVVLAASTSAAKALFRILDRDTQGKLVSQWAQILRDPTSGSSDDSVVGVAAAFGAVFQHVQASQSRNLIIDTLTSLVNNEHGISLRCTALRSLTSGVLESNVISEKSSQALHACLNDYTTDKRGDVGSLIRLEAIDATAVVLKKDLLSMSERQDIAARICGLAVEKLDKVRFRAWDCLQANWEVFSLDSKPQTLISDISQTSTSEYFLQLLSLCSHHLTQGWIRKPLLEGYVTSGGAGSESLLGASRAAFVFYTESSDLATLTVLCTYLTDIIRENIFNDRLAMPTLEFVAFLFEAGVLQRLRDRDFAWRRLFTEVRKAHFKSGNVQKIEAAVKIYAGMMAVPRVRTEVQEKLCSMLLHPYPKVRNAAADALLIVTEDESLMGVNWSKPQAELKIVVRSFQAKVGVQPAFAS
ncbi:hypothetical protein HO133_007533 [Letharia lupina]|uniref:Tubulin-specific chaperone D n=1 Tax=Letharia lupina TaxID=560253 RepID=A0A8H6FJ05_9LECA|nr:uncharacterized protein HO133_007533 [Letharia lupina]KAF6229417.1 hypothetical protein HO133_007533 [Letharia lupina]